MRMRMRMRTGSCKKSAYFILANVINENVQLTCEHHRNSSLLRNRVEGEEGNGPSSGPSEGPAERGHSAVVSDLNLTLTKIQLENNCHLPTSSTI